ncbi:heterokaryon incompatibility protein-domain-containing protein, partial [Leptodontidium sp. 2 PMI_412]
IATQWIQKCRTNHSKCNQASQTNWMPTRVLDVGTASNPRLRLHANISQLTKSIDINKLTKTFQDAIIVARRLGIQFLWIDSLCIIQGSQEDWARESSVMGDVYKNALCNIAATAAPDGRTGCFLERNPLLARTCRLRIEGLPGPAPKSQVYDLARGDFWKQGISAAPLIRRGWVLQERILAPRIIHFGKTQLFWECHELDSCEMFPDGVPREYLGDEADRFWPLDPMIDSFILWRGIVETYTKCLLTERKDKLVAISAIARQFEPILKDEYIAGLWRRHLAQHLLWKVVTPQSAALPTTDSEIYCAPSWSWASVPGPVFLNTYIARQDRPVMIEILEAKLETQTGDPMGMVTGGHIKVRGWL